MNIIPQSVEGIIELIGTKRDDEKLNELINQIPSSPICTEDREDGADYELIEFKAHGISLYFEGNTLFQVSLFSEIEDPDYSKYIYSLPYGISFDQSKGLIKDQLGKPDETGGGKDGFFGKIPNWFKYHKSKHDLHLKFSDNLKSIQAVTLIKRKNG